MKVKRRIERRRDRRRLAGRLRKSRMLLPFLNIVHVVQEVRKSLGLKLRHFDKDPFPTADTSSKLKPAGENL